MDINLLSFLGYEQEIVRMEECVSRPLPYTKNGLQSLD